MKKLSKKTINLLNKVKAHILEEPKRLNMSEFGVAYPPDPDMDAVPVCQTKGCIAGWSIFLKKPILWKELVQEAAIQGYNTNLESRLYPEEEGAKLLGITDEQAKRLFFFKKWTGEYDDAGEYLGWPEKFSNQYEAAKTARVRANATARRIDHFIATNGAE